MMGLHAGSCRSLRRWGLSGGEEKQGKSERGIGGGGGDKEGRRGARGEGGHGQGNEQDAKGWPHLTTRNEVIGFISRLTIFLQANVRPHVLHDLLPLRLHHAVHEPVRRLPTLYPSDVLAAHPETRPREETRAPK